MGKVLQIFIDASKKDASTAAKEDFELFWDCYPKKKAKLDALKAWRQTADVRPSLDELIAALDVQASSMDWQRDAGQWVPYPAKWLRQGMWADET